ncbi:MAG: hypothetical protein J7497_17695, partial [Chitinophagaceae bacterium]|nr:hypothetical protein [Chitinophagaceae bacterium]
MKSSVFLVMCLIVTFSVTGQTRIIDKTTCDNWESLQPIRNSAGLISNDGKYAVYVSVIRHGDNKIHLVGLNNGYGLTLTNGAEPKFSNNNKFFFAQFSGDSLAVVDLAKRSVMYLSGIKQYAVAEHLNRVWLITKHSQEAGRVSVKEITGDDEQEFADGENFWVNENHSSVLIKTHEGFHYVQLAENKKTFIHETSVASSLIFLKDGFCYFAADGDNYSIKRYTSRNSMPVIVCDKNSKGIPEKATILNYGLQTSSDGEYLQFYLTPPKMQSGSAEQMITEDLNIWSYKDTELRPAQKEISTFAACVNVNDGTVAMIEDEKLSADISHFSRYI